MLFQLLHETECELTTFVGRTQKSGPDDVPAVTFRLKLASVHNALLDLFSPTIRSTAYMAVPGQEQLEGIEPSTPILRCKDFKSWSPETRLEGWTVTVARGMNESTALRMGSCKLDDFDFTLYEGGHIDADFRISTADVDEEGAGMLWGRQKRKVFVRIEAPEVPVPAIDGTRGHPGAAAGQGSLLDDDGPTPESALADSLGGMSGSGPSSEGEETDTAGDPEPEEDDEGAAPDASITEGGVAELEDRLDGALTAADKARTSEGWPFPKNGAKSDADVRADNAAAEQAEFEAGATKAIKSRRGRSKVAAP